MLVGAMCSMDEGKPIEVSQLEERTQITNNSVGGEGYRREGVYRG